MTEFGTQAWVVVIGDHSLTVRADSASTVTVVPPGQQPEPAKRTVIGQLPRTVAPPIGRDQELDYLYEATGAERLVQVYGAPGAGKSTLIRHAAAQFAARDDTLVFLSGADRDVTDVLQQVFEACYDTAAYRPGPVRLRQLMAGVGIRLLIDDLDVTPEQLGALFDGVPDATILFTGTRRSLWTDGRSLELPGLTPESGVSLLANALGRPLRDDELATATELWRASDGSPLLLLRAAAGSRRTADGTLELPHPTELRELLPRAMAMLSASARDMASVLALAGFGGIAGELLPLLVADQATAAAAIDELTTLGVAITADLGPQLAPGVDVGPLVASPQQLEWIASRLDEWARTQAPAAVADHATLITRVIDATAWAGRPDIGARLAGSMTPIAACSLRLGAWEQILQRGIAASQLAGDKPTLAYLTHEDGVRNLVIGNQILAATAVGTAIALWHELGDTAQLALAEQTRSLTGTATASPAATWVPAPTGFETYGEATPSAAPNVHYAPPSAQPMAPAAQFATPSALAMPPAAHYSAPAAHYPAPGARYPAPAAPNTQAGPKPGMSLGMKLAIAGAAVIVIGGGVVGVRAILAHNHSSAPPLAIAAPPTTATQPTTSAQPLLPPPTTDAPTTTTSAPTTTDAGPAGVVETYFAAINAHDYQTAWTIEGQYTGQSMATYTAGFSTTAQDTVTIESVQGNTVIADLTAVQTDGSQRTYHGTYTVTGSSITHASVQQTG